MSWSSAPAIARRRGQARTGPVVRYSTGAVRPRAGSGPTRTGGRPYGGRTAARRFLARDEPPLPAISHARRIPVVQCGRHGSRVVAISGRGRPMTRPTTHRRWDRREHRRARPLGPLRSMASAPVTRVSVARSVRNVGGGPRQSAQMFPYERVATVGMARKMGLETESTTTLATCGRPLPSGRSPAGRRQGSSRTGRR